MLYFSIIIMVIYFVKYFITFYPIGSMYGIYANIWGILMVNVTIYSSTMDPMGIDRSILRTAQETTDEVPRIGPWVKTFGALKWDGRAMIECMTITSVVPHFLGLNNCTNMCIYTFCHILIHSDVCCICYWSTMIYNDCACCDLLWLVVVVVVLVSQIQPPEPRIPRRLCVQETAGREQ